MRSRILRTNIHLIRGWALVGSMLAVSCSGPSLIDDEGGEGGELRSIWVRLGGQAQEVRYRMIDGEGIAEGDILLPGVAAGATSGDGDQAAPQSAAVTGDMGLLWPGGIVPYVIDPNVPPELRREIELARAHWHDRTGIRLVRRSREADYVRLKRKRGVCQSYIGMQGGEQRIELDERCGVGAIVHEIGHAIGLYHEQSRSDRDLYITIHPRNIQRGELHNFPRYRLGQDLGAYDYGSVMHYDSFAFSKNGQPTITRKGGGLIPANRSGLSVRDVAGVERLYSAE